MVIVPRPLFLCLLGLPIRLGDLLQFAWANPLICARNYKIGISPGLKVFRRRSGSPPAQRAF
jgi:hypothetical protein